MKRVGDGSFIPFTNVSCVLLWARCGAGLLRVPSWRLTPRTLLPKAPPFVSSIWEPSGPTGDPQHVYLHFNKTLGDANAHSS